LADKQLALNAETLGHGPATISAQTLDVCHDVPGKGHGVADLTNDAGYSDLEQSLGFRAFAGQWTERPSRTAFDVGQPLSSLMANASLTGPGSVRRRRRRVHVLVRHDDRLPQYRRGADRRAILLGGHTTHGVARPADSRQPRIE
jgi:hypothetical protein